MAGSREHTRPARRSRERTRPARRAGTQGADRPPTGRVLPPVSLHAPRVRLIVPRVPRLIAAVGLSVAPVLHGCSLTYLFAFLPNPFSQAQSVLTHLMCVFLLESLLARCVLLCTCVFKNEQKQYRAPCFPSSCFPPGAGLLRSVRAAPCSSRLPGLRAVQGATCRVPTLAHPLSQDGHRFCGQHLPALIITPPLVHVSSRSFVSVLGPSVPGDSAV